MQTQEQLATDGTRRRGAGIKEGVKGGFEFFCFFFKCMTIDAVNRNRN